jgi:hypothetical protein
MRARPVKSKPRKKAPKKQSLGKNLLLLFLSLLFLAVTSRLFYLATEQHLYKPIEWRINKMAAKTPAQPASKKQVLKKQEEESPKVAAAGMDYMFWKILREEPSDKKP